MNGWIDVNFATIGSSATGLNWANIAQIFSPCLIAAGVAYLVAEVVKIVILLIKNRRFRVREIFKSGGMPSSHTSTVVALAALVGLENGFGSPLFAIAAIFAIVVMTDATHVRRAVGEQGEVLRKLIDRDHKQEGAISDLSRETGAGDEKTRDKLPKPYFAKGHTPPQVLAGALIGVVIGLVVYLLMR